MYQNIIFDRTSKRDSLRMQVNARLAGNFEVLLTSTDTGRLIQVCMYASQEEALGYAESVASNWDDTQHLLEVQ
jgi:hypothetical protein